MNRTEKKKLTIGFAFNLKHPLQKNTDVHAEYETQKTIDAIAGTLSSFGRVIHLPCTESFVPEIIKTKPDIVFNIAEGWGARDRESFVPVVCRMLGIPCTGSDAVTLGITMDKALTKRALRDAGIRTASFELYRSIPDTPPGFGFPAFVKPNCDGSSRGIFSGALVYNMESLRKQLRIIFEDYNQPALVEPYLDGRDFCIGLLGNNPPSVLTPCEVLLGHEQGIPFFSYEYKRLDTDRLEMNPSVTEHCLREMKEMSKTAWGILNILDYARMDFRTDANGIPYFLEVNALPGLSPVSGIFVRQAAASGISFDDLIGTIFKRTLNTIR